MSVNNPFIEFIARYGNDWVLLVREVLGGNPDEDQEWLLRSVCAGERRIGERSGHGVGKTTGLAWCNVCHILTRFPQKTVCTAPTSSQLFDALASETKAWMKKLPPALYELFEIQVDQIKLRAAPEESFIAFRTSKPETPEAMAGVHSANVMLVCDEASGIPDPVYEAAAGSMSGENAVTILTGNPVRTSGLFFDVFHKLRDKWATRCVPCIYPDGRLHPRISSDFIDDMKRRYGEDSNAYRVRVLGEFPTGDDDTVIPFELMESALNRDVRPLLVKEIWGVDCARFGNDTSALARRKGNTLVKPVEEKKGWDTMRLAGWIKAEFDLIAQERDKPSEILVDSIGIGAGVTDRLIELGLPARGINVSESPALFQDRYLNQRAELWFQGKDWFAAKDVNIGGDEALGAELVAPRFKYTSSGKIQVESKEDMKKRGIKSPNRADAFLLTLASMSVSAMSGSKNATAWNKPLTRKIAGIT